MCEQPHPPFPLHPREAPPAYLPSLYGERPSPQYALVMWSALRASRRLSTSIKFDPQSTPAKIHFPPVAPPKLTSPEYPLQNSFSPCCSANIHLLPVPCAGGGGGFTLWQFLVQYLHPVVQEAIRAIQLFQAVYQHWSFQSVAGWGLLAADAHALNTQTRSTHGTRATRTGKMGARMPRGSQL